MVCVIYHWHLRILYDPIHITDIYVYRISRYNILWGNGWYGSQDGKKTTTIINKYIPRVLWRPSFLYEGSSCPRNSTCRGPPCKNIILTSFFHPCSKSSAGEVLVIVWTPTNKETHFVANHMAPFHYNSWLPYCASSLLSKSALP